MKPVMPNQHGAWSMLIIPFGSGVAVGMPSWYHIPLFLAWLFVYLGTYPFLMYMKQKRKKEHLRWAFIYFTIAAVFGVLALTHEWKIVYAGVFMLPLFLVNIYFAKKKNERALFNDISAILTFCIGGVMSYYFGTGSIDEKAWLVLIICFLFFMGSTFYVKTMIREKNNSTYKWLSWTYHTVLVAGAIFVSPLLAIAFIPSLIRAVWLYGKKVSVIKVGVLEIANAVYFFFAILYFL
ncbi:MAG: YwiC-like family protein [Ectobacillus sp.]